MKRLIRILFSGLLCLSLMPVTAFAQPGPGQPPPPPGQRPPQGPNGGQRPPQGPDDEQREGQRPPQNNGQRPPQGSNNGQRPSQGHHDNQRPSQRPDDNRRPSRPTDAEIAARATAGAVTVIAATALAMPIPADDHYVFGMDIRGFGDAATGCKVGGGVGLDMWFRPIRWVSVELYTDFVLNTNKDLYQKEGSDKEMLLRMPIYLGARIHIFDYAAYNVYAAVAGGVNIQFIADHDSEIGGGLQAGVGAAYVFRGFSIGVDVRYTMESLNSRFDRRFMHGCIFAFNLGFAR